MEVTWVKFQTKELSGFFTDWKKNHYPLQGMPKWHTDNFKIASDLAKDVFAMDHGEGILEASDRKKRQAAEMFDAGMTRAEVSRQTGVSWRSVHEWFLAWQQGGSEAMKSASKPGPKPKFSDEEVLQLAGELKRGAISHGYTAELWTLPRVRRLVIDMFGRKLSTSETWRLLRRIGWSPQKPVRRARERDEDKIANWKEVEWPRIQAKARKEKRTLVFIDESGLSQKPSAKNTWALEGKTPVIQMNFNWKKLSVIGGITIRSITSSCMRSRSKLPSSSTFSSTSRSISKAKQLVVWDNLPAHRSKTVAGYLASTKGSLGTERRSEEGIAKNQKDAPLHQRVLGSVNSRPRRNMNLFWNGQ